MKLTARLLAAASAFREGKRLRTFDVVDATVRPHEEQRRYYARSQFFELMNRYGRYIKVAASRTATAVASTPLRVYRYTDGQKSSWNAKALTRGRHVALRKSAGFYAGKMLGDTEDDVEEIDDPQHPLVRLLHEVNGRDNGYQLLEDTQLALGLVGNAYWAIVRNGGGEPDELWPLQPQWVEVIPSRSSETTVGGYRYGRGHDIERVYAPEDVIHFRQPNPIDPYYGMGDLAACWQDADLSNLINEAAVALLKNGAQPGVIISGEGIATEANAKQMESTVNAKHRGASNWYRTLFLWRKVDVKVVEIPKGAVDFLALPADKVREVIANCFDMPVSALTQDASSLASTESQDQRWKRTGIVPRLKRIEDQINARLVPHFAEGTAGRLFVAFDNPVAEDETVTGTVTVSLFTGDLITRNEGRARMGYEPVDDGDQFKSDYAPAFDPLGGFGNGNSPGGGRGEGEPDPEAEGGKRLVHRDDPAAPGGDGGGVLPGRGGVADVPGKGAAPGGDHGNREGVRLILPFTKSLRTAKGTDAHLILRGPFGDANAHERCCKDDDRLRPHRRAKPGDEGMERAVSRWMRTAGDVVAAALADGRPMDSVREELGRTFMEATGEPIESVFGEGFNEGIGRVLAVRPALGESAVTFDARPERAVQFLQGYRIRLKDAVLDSMSDRVNVVLQESIGEGGSIADATTALRAEFDHLSGYGAERIARTETSRAYGMGNIAGWKELPGVTHKEWLLSSAPCDMCAELHARRPVVRLDEPFAQVGEVFGGVMVTYAPVYTATLHPNDSCAVTFKFEDEVEG